jgi:DNA polymerase-3 subunit delta
MAKKKPNDAAGLDALKAALKTGNYARLYLLHGEEAYLREYYLGQLRKKLVSGPMEEFNYHRFEGKSLDLDDLSGAVEMLPMMADKTLVEVVDYDLFKTSESDREKLVAMLSDLPDYCCLVFVFDTVAYSPDGRLKKLSAAVKDNGVAVEFGKQSESLLVDWVRRRFRAAGKTIDDSQCRYLIFLTGGSMTTMGSEIDKVAAYAAGTEVTRSDIDAMVDPVLDAQVFDITNAMADKKFDVAMQKLRDIFKLQQEPIMVCAVIGSQLRRLRCARVLMGAGKGAGDLMKLCGMGDYAARLTMTSARKFSDGWCDRAVVAAAETDYKLKTSFDDGERLVELLLMQLALEARQ